MELLTLVGKQLGETKFYLDPALKDCVLSHSHLIPAENLHRLNAEMVSHFSAKHPICVVDTQRGFKVVCGVATYRLFVIHRELFIKERCELYLHLCTARRGKKLACGEAFSHPLLLSLDSTALKALGHQFKVSKNSESVRYFVENTGINSERALASFLNVSRGALFP